MKKSTTKIIPENEIAKASRILSNGGIIAFPTDTVWGIGCVVENSAAVEKIYKIKSREANKPLILLGSKLEYLLPFIEFLPDKAEELINKYLPGPLTLVLKKSNKTPGYITAGFDTVGIRIPDHPVFLELLDKAVKNHVLATTSANVSGKGSVASKDEVIDALGNSVDFVLDDYGFRSEGKESTVASVDINNKIKVLRQGAVII